MYQIVLHDEVTHGLELGVAVRVAVEQDIASDGHVAGVEALSKNTLESSLARAGGAYYSIQATGDGAAEAVEQDLLSLHMASDLSDDIEVFLSENRRSIRWTR